MLMSIEEMKRAYGKLWFENLIIGFIGVLIAFFVVRAFSNNSWGWMTFFNILMLMLLSAMSASRSRAMNHLMGCIKIEIQNKK